MMYKFVFLVLFAICHSQIKARLTQSPNELSTTTSRTVNNNNNNRLQDTFCSSPVNKAKVTFPGKIIGRAKVNFDMYSGYVNISSAPDYLFYWFFSTKDQNTSAPLIIWTNGGPGCTSMEGATTENGPLSLFDIKESCQGEDRAKCDYTQQLSMNPYSWNAHANVLYLDQPKNVGYSFGYGTETKSSVEAADDFIIFYQNWVSLFPEFVGRKVIIAGESYGGHYIPAWSNAILNYNEQHKQAGDDNYKAINLVGVVIGNGCVNDTVQNTEAFIQFQHETNLIPSTANPKTYSGAYSAMISYIGYVPNYYDYRIQSITCDACYGYNYTAWSYWFLQPEVLTALNICGEAGTDAFSGSAGGCISLGAFDAHDNFDYSGALARTLEAKVPVTLFYGKTDTACNYVGGETLAETISWTGREGFQKALLKPLLISGVEAGQVRTYDGLTLILIENAGHMVPQDQPAGATAAINSILDKI